jgi:hypothetical protein
MTVNLQTKMLVKNLIEQLDMEKCLKNSFKNYHTEGLFYINLYRDNNLTIKLYFLMPGLVKNRNVGYLVSPHTHAYNFTTEVLFGSIRHITLKEDKIREGEPTWYRYLYESFKSPEDRLSFSGATNLKVDTDIEYRKGEAYYVDTEMIHSLIAPENHMTCLLLHQYEDKVLDGTDFYTTVNETPSFRNIYAEYTEEEVNTLLNLVKLELGI